jgi:HD superfamily phosphohydrolase
LNRDSYHAGTLEYGSVDHERIIDGFRVKDWRLLISKPAVGALLDSFIALQHMYANVYYHRTSRIFEFMIYDALSLMPELLRSIVSSPSELLNYDDLTLIVEVKHRRSLKGEDRYEEAYQIFRDVLDRRKRYATIYEHRLSLRTVSRREAELEKLKRNLEEAYRDISLKVDYRAEIRPIGVDLTRLLSLIEAPMIMDEDRGRTISLKEFSDASYRTLSRYQIIFHIFADRRKTLSGKYDGMLGEVKRETENELTRIEAEEGLE